MTDSRPEITVKADGASVVLQFRRNGIHFSGDDISFSIDEAFALQCQLGAAIEGAKTARMQAERREQIEAGVMMEAADVRPETWRDRESML